jgi:hypothetical protein
MLRAKNARGGTTGSFEGSSMQDNSGRLARIPATIAASVTPAAYPLVNAAMFAKLEKLDRKSKDKLAEAMLDPDKFLSLLNRTEEGSIFKAFLDNKYANRIPGIMGQISAQQLGQ